MTASDIEFERHLLRTILNRNITIRIPKSVLLSNKHDEWQTAVGRALIALASHYPSVRALRNAANALWSLEVLAEQGS